MSRCGECGQEKAVTDDDMLAARIGYYRSAHAMLSDLWKKPPPEWQVLRAARFLAQEDPNRSDAADFGDDDDDDNN